MQESTRETITRYAAHVLVGTLAAVAIKRAMGSSQQVALVAGLLTALAHEKLDAPVAARMRDLTR